jgi:hypothetical protein
LDCLRRIEPFQWVAPTPKALFSFLAASGGFIAIMAYKLGGLPPTFGAPSSLDCRLSWSWQMDGSTTFCFAEEIVSKKRNGRQTRAHAE